ncbi:MAG TPA: GAF domain-containing protein, partial [Pyrinomonadaceae bacterium]
MIRIKPLISYLSATGIGIVAGLIGYAFFALNEPFAAATLVVYALAVSLTMNRFGLRRCWRWLLVSAVVVAGIGVVGFQCFGVDLLPLPLLFSGGVSLLLIQINRLWSLDRQLTRRLFNSSTSNAESNANARLRSGLKLLNTVLPLSEAVVFRCDDSNSLEAVARLKGAAPNAQDPRRNSVWREGINLCQQAVAGGKLVSQTTANQNSSTVAVPLLHEGETAGVLLIRLASEFSVEDTPLLEAVSSQFARNLERESFSKSAARTQSLSYFSQSGSRRKLDALNVLKAVTVEQRCEAST